MVDNNILIPMFVTLYMIFKPYVTKCRKYDNILWLNTVIMWFVGILEKFVYLTEDIIMIQLVISVVFALMNLLSFQSYESFEDYNANMRNDNRADSETQKKNE